MFVEKEILSGTQSFQRFDGFPKESKTEVQMILTSVIFIITLALTFLCEYLLSGRQLSLRRCIRSGDFWRRGIIGIITEVFIFSAVNYDFFAILNLSVYKFFIFLAIAISVSVIGFMISLCRRVTGMQKVGYITLSILLCILACEFFIFNSRSIQSHEYVSDDFSDIGTISGCENVFDKSYSLEKGKSATFEVKDIDVEIKNLYVGVTVRNSDGEKLAYTVKVEATDRANELYITSMPKRTVYSESLSQYIPMQLRGNSDKLRITITPSVSQDVIITFGSIKANTPKPFDFDSGRIFFLFILCIFIYAISPKSPLHKMTYEKSPLQSSITAVAIVFEIILVFVIIASSSHFLQNISAHQAQYQQLAESFTHGHLYLEKEVPEWLLEMENPYDYSYRYQLASKYGSFYWDSALFNGHYYVYFGVVPCILLYLPYHLLTGGALPNDIAIFIFAIVFIIGVFSLIKQVIARYFPNLKISYLTYLLLCLLLINGSGLIYIASYADMYSVPITSALAFTVVGLSLWLSALGKKKFRAVKLALGSLCMALVAGCRPNLLLFSFLCIPFFIGEVILAFKERRIFKKESIRNAIAFALPYMVVAICIMWYNYARFESPFDFGANYNLTTNDMTSRGFVWDRMLPATYSYLFQLPKFTATFPFIRFSDFDTYYMGVTIRESTYGGIFSYSPFLLLIFAIPVLKEKLREKKVLLPAVILAICGIITPLLDAQFAGILQRYFGDFSFMLYLSAAFIFLTVADIIKSDVQRKIIHTGLFACAILMIGYQGVLVLKAGQLSDVLPYLFWY